jgi:hypothetical protein
LDEGAGEACAVGDPPEFVFSLLPHEFREIARRSNKVETIILFDMVSQILIEKTKVRNVSRL